MAQVRSADLDLSLPEVCALLVLMAEAGEVPNTELKRRYQVSLDGKSRMRLNEAGLVASRKVGRGLHHALTDRGWSILPQLMAEGLPARRGSAAAALSAVVGGLVGYLHRSRTSLAEVFAPEMQGGTAVDSTGIAADSGIGGAAAPDEVESRLRAGYRRLATPSRAWVRLTDLRAYVAGVDRSAVDAVLVRMGRLENVFLIAAADQKLLTVDDRAAAVTIGGEPKHLLKIEE